MCRTKKWDMSEVHFCKLLPAHMNMNKVNRESVEVIRGKSSDAKPPQTLQLLKSCLRLCFA